MKRRSIAGVLVLSLTFNLFYCIAIGVTILCQEAIKLKAGYAPDVAAQFSLPITYIIFALITLLMQIVLFMSFATSMRFDHPTLWIESVSIILYGGVFRIFYHYIPELEDRMIGSFSAVEYASRTALNEIISGKLDWIFALASACFLAGAGMTICFKKMIRYWLR